MRENFTYGSVRGAASNGGPYRDRHSALCQLPLCFLNELTNQDTSADYSRVSFPRRREPVLYT